MLPTSPKYVGKYQREARGFRHWFGTRARNHVIRYWRSEAAQTAPGGNAAMSQMHQVTVPEPSSTQSGRGGEEPGALSGLLGILFRRVIERTARDFGETTWKAFLLVVIEDRSPAEAAAALGLTPSAVYLAKALVLSRLRDELAGLIGP
jgi:DNA-directed RNA polymerase specialized sigma24 family protein